MLRLGPEGLGEGGSQVQIPGSSFQTLRPLPKPCQIRIIHSVALVTQAHLGHFCHLTLMRDLFGMTGMRRLPWLRHKGTQSLPPERRALPAKLRQSSSKFNKCLNAENASLLMGSNETRHAPTQFVNLHNRFDLKPTSTEQWSVKVAKMHLIKTFPMNCS